ENTDHPSNVGVFLADSHVDRIHRAEIRISSLLSSFVDLGLIENCIDGDGGLAGCTIADDEFALAPADRDHCVDGHDPCLNGLAYAFALDNAESDVLDRVKLRSVDRSLAIERFSQGIHHATKQT